MINETTNINKQNPVLNGYHIESDLDDVLKSTYNKSPLGYHIIDWFVNEVKNWKIKWFFILKTLGKTSL